MPETYGCKGGFPPKCWKYIKQTGFMATAESYPYQNQVLPCRIDSRPNAIAGKLTLSGYSRVKSAAQDRKY